MNNKSYLSVNNMLVIAIAVIMVIGFVATIQIFFPWIFTGFACPQLQRQHIDEMNTAIQEVILTGVIQTISFKVESCVQCIWLDDTDPNIILLVVEFESTNESFSTPLVWNIDDQAGCPGGWLVGDKTCTFEITTNNVDLQSC